MVIGVSPDPQEALSGAVTLELEGEHLSKAVMPLEEQTGLDIVIDYRVVRPPDDTAGLMALLRSAQVYSTAAPEYVTDGVVDGGVVDHEKT